MKQLRLLLALLLFLAFAPGAFATDAIVTLPDDSANAGKKLDESSLTVGANTVVRQRIVIADPTTAASIAAVKAASTAPAATDPALVIAINPGGNLTKLTDGTNTTAVKAASTAAVATDPAAVVSLSPNSAITPPTLTKGTQGSTGLSVQDLKDAGRTAVNLYVTNVAGATSATEQLLTLTQASGTGATTSSSTFAIASGKTFRITSLTFFSQGSSTATTQTTTFNVRLNTGGTCIVSSTPIQYSVRTQTPATALAFDRISVPLGDGWEIVGSSTMNLCVTANGTWVTNAPSWGLVITGYTY